MSSLRGPLGPGLLLCWDEKRRRYFRFLRAWWRLQEGRRFQNDGGTDQAGRPHKQSAPTGDEAIREPEIGSALARAIEDQQLMFDEDGLGNYGADAAATCKSGDGGEEMDEKDHEIAHFRILTTKRKLAEFRAS